jgi:hypothetical protein
VVQELRPRGVGEILDVAVALYRARFRALMTVSVIFVLPLGLLQMFVFLSALPDDYTVANNGVFTPQYKGPEDQLLNLAALLVTVLVSTLGSAVVTAASTKIVADEYMASAGPDEPPLKTTFRRIVPIFAIALLFTIVTSFCVLAGYFIVALWAVALPVLMLERVSVSRSLSRSYELTKTHYGLTLGVYWGSQILVSILTLGSAGLLTLFIFTGDHSVTTEVISQSVANAVVSVVMTPFTACALVALYFDLRIRNEGYDVQALIARLDRRQTDASRA